MNRVIITGATSMIGIALIKACIANGVEVLAIVRRQSGRLDRLPESGLIRVYECELSELESVELTDGKYDVFYHLAWGYTSKAERDNPLLQEKNIRYTLDAVELAKRSGCYKFVGAGSQAEYGRCDSVIGPETGTVPEISYGIAKYAAGKLSEKLCRNYNMIHIWGRVFSVYGRYDNEGTMLVYAIQQFLKGRAAGFSAATQLWDYLHEDDAGMIFYYLGERAAESKVYCIASGESRPLKEFILEMRDCFGPEAQCLFEAEASGGKLVSLQADVSGLVRDTGYKPQVNFKDGIRDMIKYRAEVENNRCT